MKRLLFVLVLLVAGAIGLAFYMGWVGFTSDSAGGFFNITFHVNRDKFEQDENKALEKVQGIGGPAKDSTTPPAQPPQKPE
jgi:hypothetical protein